MRKRLLLVPLLCTLATPELLAQRRGGRRAEPVELENFTFRVVDYDAPSLNAKRSQYAIYLPVGYDEAANAGRRYPWVIWLHGMNGDYRRFHQGGAEVLDRLRGEGKVPPMVFVAASSGRRTLYVNGELDGDYENQIVVDLRRHVEANFRVATDPAHRAIAGVSIGGAGALKIAFKHRDLFGTVAVLSAALLPADPAEVPERFGNYLRMGQAMGWDVIFGDPLDPKEWAKEMPLAMLGTMSADDLQGLAMFVDAGTADNYGFAPTNIAFHEALAKMGVPHTWNLAEGGGHAWSDPGFADRLARSLEFLGKALAKSGAASGQGKDR